MPAFINLNGQIIHYADQRPAANDAAPALVFANSLGTDFRIWDDVVAAFAHEFRCVRYDKRGHGLSAAPPAPYRMEQHIDDLAALLDKLGVDNAIVCGVSVGGMIAQGLAARRPEQVRALVLCDTGAIIGTRSIWDERIAAIRQGGMTRIADATMQRWFTPPYHQTQPDRLTGWRNMLVRTPVEGYVGTAAAIRGADLRADSATISAPTLVLCGDQDGATPPDLGRELAALIPGARFALIADCGHLPSLEQPDALTDALRAFITTLPN